MADKINDERIKNFLLQLCVEQRDKLESAKQENGMDESVLTVDGEIPEHQKTIVRLVRHIDKQDKWLKKRKEEVSVLTNALTECNKRKKFYKDKAGQAKRQLTLAKADLMPS